jgi:hypothetical protein
MRTTADSASRARGKKFIFFLFEVFLLQNFLFFGFQKKNKKNETKKISARFAHAPFAALAPECSAPAHRLRDNVGDDNSPGF